MGDSYTSFSRQTMRVLLIFLFCQEYLRSVVVAPNPQAAHLFFRTWYEWRPHLRHRMGVPFPPAFPNEVVPLVMGRISFHTLWNGFQGKGSIPSSFACRAF